MKNALNSPEMEGITPEYVMQFEKKLFKSMVDAMPEEELFSLPKLKHRLEVFHRDREKKGEAKMLTRQLQRRFGDLPAWVCESLSKADLSSLEEWSLRIFDARSLDEVFRAGHD
ncbi:MAG: DUF4351 domain-containing protein [Magnetococcales bacterium]|nr:DUF4351 domain-containing protein [Magnetococcales bacterium]